MKWLILVTFLCFFSLSESRCQTGVNLTHHSLFQVKQVQKSILTKVNTKAVYKQKESITPQIPMAYCYQNLAFFCKIEVKMEKASFFPVKFRLGSVPYVDYLEQK